MKLYIILAITFSLSWLINKYLIKFCNKRDILDKPNHRSSHSVPVPRLGGIAIVISFLIGMYLLNYYHKVPHIQHIAIPILVLGTVSLIDDIKPISALFRLLVQFICIIYAVSVYGEDKLLFNGHIPYFWDRAVMVIGMVYFINCVNFMDGIDMITSFEVIHICVSVVLIALSPSLPSILIASILGFLYFNKAPAKIFCGDAGSMTIGFLLSWFLLEVSFKTSVFQGIMLGFYYLLDPTITLIRRLANSENIFEAHNKYFFQQAIRKGYSHTKTAFTVAFVNFVTMLLTYMSLVNLFIPLFLVILINTAIVLLFAFKPKDSIL